MALTKEVWHLANFATGARRDHCAALFTKLEGTQRLVRGNHDIKRV